MFRPRRGFTLVEMLLVVSILMILIAMLLPSLQRARLAAREVMCKTNIAQIGRAIFSYAGSNQKEFPANRFRPDSNLNQHVTWRALLVRGHYADLGNLWICPNPSPTQPQYEKNITIHGSFCLDDVLSNYCYNGAAMWRFSPNGSPDQRPASPQTGIYNQMAEVTMNTILFPSRTFLLMETVEIFPDLGDWTIGWPGPDGGGSIGHWHRRGGMYLICDGHVEWSMLLNTGIPQCWWHNIAEPVNAHIDWKTQCNPNYLP